MRIRILVPIFLHLDPDKDPDPEGWASRKHTGIKLKKFLSQCLNSGLPELPIFDISTPTHPRPPRPRPPPCPPPPPHHHPPPTSTVAILELYVCL